METKNENESLRHIFRAYDIRGIFNQEITPINIFRIGLAFGTFLQRKKGFKPKNDHVFVAYDVRQTSPLLGQAFAAGLMTTGINIEYSGEPLQFGACMYSGVKGKALATAFITASHLPPEWNGVKFYYGSGVGFSEEDNMNIRDIFFLNNFIRPGWEEVGQMKRKNLKNEYREYLCSKITLKRQLKVVIDCGNGSSCLSAPDILESIGLEVVPLFCEIDPTFPNRSSEPNEESLQQLSTKVIQENADFGVGFDGDGDRAVIVDNKGRILLADITGLLLAKFMLPQFEGKNRILANVECSLALEKVLTDSAIVDRIKVGHTFLTADAQIKKDTLLGVESSGHFVFPHIYLFDDAMIVPLIIAEMLTTNDEPLSVLVDQIPILHKRKIAVHAQDNIKFTAIAELLKEIKDEYLEQVNDIDGIGISFGTESWVLMRASNTGPKIRVIVEADSDSRAEELLTVFQNKLEYKLKELIN